MHEYEFQTELNWFDYEKDEFQNSKFNCEIYFTTEYEPADDSCGYSENIQVTITGGRVISNAEVPSNDSLGVASASFNAHDFYDIVYDYVIANPEEYV